jgi:hypothetical protein
MSEYRYSFNLPGRLKNLEDYIKLLDKEKSLRQDKINELKSIEVKTYDDELELVQEEKKIVELDQEILSKKDFLNELKKKQVQDENEFKKNLAEANTRYAGLKKEVEKFLDEDEEENNGFSWTGNFLNYQLNSMILSKDEGKDEGKFVFWYNALKKEFQKAVSIKNQKGKEKESNSLKVVSDSESEQ